MEKGKDTSVNEKLVRELFKTNQKLKGALNEKYLLLQHVHDLRDVLKSLQGHINKDKQIGVSAATECKPNPIIPVPEVIVPSIAQRAKNQTGNSTFPL
ncbi:MAG: hypothetical protein GY699_08835 [Desulfobacteraceae bacterium]|nr:hypothetical protein [Desulfobacteraceae bacterium]